MTAAEIYDKIKDIPGWFTQDDVEVFMSLKLPNKPTIFECGTYCGKSALAFRLIWPKADIFSCDPVDEPSRATGYYKFTNSKGVDVRFDKPIDLLFIDDSHFYDDIKANFDKFEPLVKKGGYIVFHDYCFETSAVDGVRRFVNELGDCRIHRGQYGEAIWVKK